MKLELREIASVMVGPSEPFIDLQAPSQEGVTTLALRIQLRDALSEMHLSENAVTTQPSYGRLGVNSGTC